VLHFSSKGRIITNMNLTAKEQKLVDLLVKHDKITDLQITRKSEKEFDLELRGKEKSYHFISGLRLHAIKSLTTWPKASIANMSDYPEMVSMGDWSGIRDSSDEAIDAIFQHHVVRRFCK
jgi:hypothetical protein